MRAMAPIVLARPFTRIVVGVAAALALFSCQGSGSAEDGGGVDSGSKDAGPIDAGSIDAG